LSHALVFRAFNPLFFFRQWNYINWQLAREKIRVGKVFNKGNTVLLHLKRYYQFRQNKRFENSFGWIAVGINACKFVTKRSRTNGLAVGFPPGANLHQARLLTAL
jgi:hypothetical protein